MTDRVAVGDEDYLYDASIQKKMLKEGITHVLDCRAEADERFRSNRYFNLCHRADENFVRIVNGCWDDGQAKRDAYWRISIEFGKAALAQPGTKLYVHCAAGINRGPSNAYAILRAVGYSALEAENLIRGGRPIVGLAYQKNAEGAVRRMGYGVN